MDARFLLQGLKPVIDYGSRQPLYVSVLALFLKSFGVSFAVGRLVPLFSTLASGALLFLIGKNIFSWRAGFIAAALSLFLPLTLIWSATVKTEPMTILLSCLAVYVFFKALDVKKAQWIWIALAGIFSACAFYVRQPALYMPIAIFLYIISSPSKWQKKFIHLLAFVGGYAAIVLIAFILYSEMSVQDFLFSQLNPLYLVWNRLLHIFGAVPEQYQIVDSSGFRILGQDIDYTITAWRQAIFLSLFVLTAAYFAFAFIKKQAIEKKDHFMFLLFWFGCALLLYLYQTLNKSFYTQYFTEMLPPLFLLTGLWLADKFRQVSLRKFVFYLCAMAAVFAAAFVVQRLFWRLYPGIGGYLILSAFVVSGFTGIVFSLPGKRVLTLMFGNMIIMAGIHFSFSMLNVEATFTGIAGIIAFYYLSFAFLEKSGFREKLTDRIQLLTFFFAFLITAFFSGHVITFGYEAVWTPDTVYKVNHVLQKHADPGDHILSGGMIWTFESGSSPYQGVSHPTQFLKKEIDDFKTEFRANRPEYIILDGYTERKFTRYWTFIHEEMEKYYSEIARIEGSQYPVRIYSFSTFPHKVPSYFSRLSGSLELKK